MIYRIFSRSFFALRLSILLLLLLFSVLLLLLSKESGSRFLLEKAVQYTPGFSLEGSSGSFLQGLSLQNPRYEYEGVSVQAEQIHFSIHPLVLLRGQLRVAQLRSEGLHLIILSDDSDNSPSTAIEALPAIATPLPINIKKLQLNNSQLTINQQTWPIHSIDARLRWWRYTVSLDRFVLKTAEQSLDAEGHLRMHNDWPIEAKLQWHSLLPASVASLLNSPSAQGQVNASGNVLNIQLQQTISTAQEASIKSQLNLQAFSVPMQFNLAAQWPLLDLHIKEQEIQVAQAKLQVAGTLDDYTLQLQSKITPQQQATFDLKLSAQGNSEAFEQLHLTLQEQEQSLTLQGQVRWLPSLRWQLEADAQHINPGLWFNAVAGDISAQLRSQGQWGDNSDIQLAIEQLQGTLDQQALSGYSRIHWRKKQGVSSDTALQAGTNRLLAKGDLSHDKLNFALEIHSEDLSQIASQLGGSIQLAATLTGSRTQPLLQGEGHAQQLRFADSSIQQLLLQANTPQHQQFDGLLQLNTIKQGDMLIADKLRLTSHGDRYTQQWQLDVQRDTDTLTAVLDNRWRDKKGQATLQSFVIDSDSFGQWSLAESATAHYSEQHVDFPKHCLQQHQQQGQLCFQAQQQPQNLHANMQLQHLDLAPFAAYLSEDVDIYAMLSAQLSLQQSGQQRTVMLNVHSTPGYLRYFSDAEELARISWQEVALQGELDNDAYQAALNIHIDNNNWLKQTLQGNIQEQAIAGRLQLQLSELQWVELISPVRQLDGKIAGDIQLSGSYKVPEIEGQIQLLANSFLIPDAGLQIDNARIRLQADKQQMIRLDGELYSGGEALHLSGTADTQQAFPWPVKLEAKGSNVLALNLESMRLRIDPNLSIEIDGQWIKTRGEVYVREASVKLRELPASAQSPSADTIIVGEEEKQTPWFIDSDITILLGDKFNVQGMGLDAKFGGDVRIQDAPQQALSLTGLVNVSEGRYRAYGQNLVIERGQIFFQGPADDPGLDILATRTLSKHNVKVGLEIGGTLKYPRTRVFSDPLMDETEAMSWLLFGKPLSGASENDGTLILQAVAVYGIEQGDFITQNLSDKLGIDVGFDTAGENDQTAFTLGKQLSPRIYLRYSVGLFDNLSTLMVRYQLSQHMHLETQSTGEANSIDLQYKLER